MTLGLKDFSVTRTDGSMDVFAGQRRLHNARDWQRIVRPVIPNTLTETFARVARYWGACGFPVSLR
jgi:hypothetical protein